MIIYIILINIVGLVAIGLDKQKAKKKQWRIKESYFFVISFFGGSLGTWIGMYIFRHKTNKWPFILGISFIFIIQIILYLLLNIF